MPFGPARAGCLEGVCMRIEVVGRHVDITDAIRQYCEQKAEKLPRFYDGVQMITFNISRPDHQHQAEYDVELVLDVVKHDDFIAHGKERDLYAAVDLAVAKGTRQLSEFKDRLRDTRH